MLMWTQAETIPLGLQSSIGPINGDVPVSGGRMLRGAVGAQVATGVEWRARAETVKARVAEFKALFIAK